MTDQHDDRSTDQSALVLRSMGVGVLATLMWPFVNGLVAFLSDSDFWPLLLRGGGKTCTSGSPGAFTEPAGAANRWAS